MDIAEGLRFGTTHLSAYQLTLEPNTAFYRKPPQLPEHDACADMQLAVSHSLPQTLKYSLGMMLPSGGQVYATASCPVPPGLTTYETWPNPVFQLVIRDLRLLPEGTPLTCEK